MVPETSENESVMIASENCKASQKPMKQMGDVWEASQQSDSTLQKGFGDKDQLMNRQTVRANNNTTMI